MSVYLEDRDVVGEIILIDDGRILVKYYTSFTYRFTWYDSSKVMI